MSKREPNLYKRGKTWWVKIERQGNRIHESTDETSLAEARKYRDRAHDKLKRIKNGLRDDKTYDDVMAEFLNDCMNRLKPGGVKRYKVSARAIHPYFTGKKICDISKATIVHCLSDRKQVLTGSGVNRERALLSAMFTYACDRDYVEFNPVLAVKRSRESEARTRNLTPQEVKAVVDVSNKLLSDMVLFTVETGLRVSELIYLTWRQVNLEKHEITLDETKSGKTRIVPLSVKAHKILTSQIRHIQQPYVFWHADGKPYKDVARAFQAAAGRAKVKDVIFHDLRRTFTCWLYSGLEGRKKVPLHILSELLGHSSFAVTEKHYAFLTKEDLHEAIRGKSSVTKSSHKQGTLSVNDSATTKRRARKC